MKRALMVATVSQSLQFQSPAMLDVLQSRGYELTFAAREDAWTDGLKAIGSFVPIEGSRRPSPRSLLRMRKQLKDVLRQPWDLIQTQSPIASAAIRATSRLDCPSVYVAHGFHFHREGSRTSNAGFKGIEWALAGRTKALAVVSGEDFESAVRMGLHQRALLWRLPGAGVDLDVFRPPQDGADRFGAVFCGELNQNKDPLLAISAVRAVRERGNEMSITLIGDGPLAPVIAQLASKESWIDWQPSLPAEHVASRLQGAAVLLAPSHREGLPRVIIEAIAAGAPVVARANRGSREILGPLVVKARGELLETGDSEAWADAIERQVGKGGLTTEQRSIVDRYDASEFASSYSALVKRVEAGEREGAVDLGPEQAS